MEIREASVADIVQLHGIRTSVRENRLSNPLLISEDDYREYLTKRGKGWLCEIDDSIVGFAIVDLEAHNVWALFVYPDYEGKGVGRLLHDTMIDWYFSQTHHPIWLSTSPATRAERFYAKAGWTNTGLMANGEVRFEKQHS